MALSTRNILYMIIEHASRSRCTRDFPRTSTSGDIGVHNEYAKILKKADNYKND